VKGAIVVPDSRWRRGRRCDGTVGQTVRHGLPFLVANGMLAQPENRFRDAGDSINLKQAGLGVRRPSTVGL